MGMSSEEFWQMRLKEFFLKLRAFFKSKESDQKLHANLVRMQTVELMNIQLSEEDKIRSPQDLWKFPWEEGEEEEEEEELDEEKAMQNLKKLSKLL